MDRKFVFSRKEFDQNYIFDGTLKDFRKLQEGASVITLTIREILQNSLDARINFDKPAIVNIEFKEIDKDELPSIGQIFNTINHLDPKNKYTLENVNRMKSLEKQKKVQVLIADDVNTKGLSGAYSNKENSIFNSYAYSKGMHNEVDDEQLENTRGGSHGVGKISNNAASLLNLMYFVNHDENGDKQIGGSVFLFDHKIDDQGFDGVGYYTDIFENKNKKVRVPYKLDNRYSDIFSKNERGLKVIVPYLMDESINFEDTVKSVIDNYFIAITFNNLVVNVKIGNKEISISQENILEIVTNDDFYKIDLDNREYAFTRRYLETYLEDAIADEITFSVGSKDKDEYKFYLYLSKNKDEAPIGQIAIVKSVGMKIQDMLVHGRSTQPFNGVLICDKSTDAYIKTLENQSHTKLEYDNILDKKSRNKAEKFLQILRSELRKKIDNLMEEEMDEEGELDTSDLFFLNSKTFEKSINKNKKKVKIEGGGELIKDVKERRDKTGNPNDQKPESKDIRKRTPRKIQKGDDGTKFITLSNNSVKRVLVGNREILEFDFNGIPTLSDKKSFNLNIVSVDGEGREYKDEINLATRYRKVEDLVEQRELILRKKVIPNISINNKKSKLRLTLSENSDRNRKFIYRLELKDDLQ